MRNKHSHPLQGEVHTLAQTGTGILQPVEKFVMGIGSDLTDKKAWKGRAKRKGLGKH
jgi:hypothetical protein